MNLSDLRRFLAPLVNRVSNMVAAAVVKRVNDATKTQEVQIDCNDGETRDDVQRVQNYGFTSVPVEGAEAAVIFVGGRRDHGLVVAVEDPRYRPANLESGEVLVYDKNGSKILLKKNGDIEITAQGNVKFNGGSTPVAKEGSGTTGHMHTLTGTAGPYPISGTAVTATDSIATSAGSSTVKVP